MIGEADNQMILKGRKELLLKGVKELLRFDDTLAEFSTVNGDLIVTGSGIRVAGLDLEQGEVSVQGDSIDALEYLAEPKTQAPSGWKRLFSHS